MGMVLQCTRVWKATPSDTDEEPYPFVGLQIGADATVTSLTVLDLYGTTVEWADGELSPGVTYPISGVRINNSGTGADSAITLYGS